MSASQFFFTSFQELINIGDLIGYNELRSKNLPRFEEEDIIDLCDETIEKLIKLPNIVKISGEIIFIGDIHGNLHDLLKILKFTQLPPISKLVFLGDYVDRGNFSTEVLLLLFSLFCCHQDNIVLLRGNHEFDEVCSIYGFKDEVMINYPNSNVYQKFLEVFSYLPLVSIINNSALALHGGLSPHLQNISELNLINRPITDLKNPIIRDILWADPISEMIHFTESQRGSGVLFGLAAARQFFKKNSLKLIIRGHQCVEKGIEILGKGLIITVFSTSNYQPNILNYSGILLFNENGTFLSKNFPPIITPNREETCFIITKRFNKILDKTPYQMSSTLCMKLLIDSKKRHTNPKIQNISSSKRRYSGSYSNLTKNNVY